MQSDPSFLIPTDITSACLVGKSVGHLCRPARARVLGARLHRDAVASFRKLRAAAAKEGFDLAVLSGFRNFKRQLSIWNRKATGQLAVLDSDARPLDITRLTPRELVFAILRWSALPGASRHHWGTDLDVYDKAAAPRGYEVELIPAEVDAGGMFAPLHEWLDQRIADGTAFGFFRPYDVDRQGVAPERWHLSFAPIASKYLRRLSVNLLRKTIKRAEIELKDEVLANLPEIHRRFVANVSRRHLSS